MQKNLADHLRRVMNSGPFGFSVTYPSMKGHEVQYTIEILFQGECDCVWTMETKEGGEILASLLQDFIAKDDDYYIVQAEIYRALCVELAAVVRESEVDESLARVLNLEYPCCYLSDRPRMEVK